MEERYWYAIETDEDDNDWGTGSIDGGYDEQGHETTDPICVALYESGEDF